MKKVVLAFSGGLDTTYCTKYLQIEKGMEVHAVTVNTGGFDSAEAKELESRALALGAASYTFIDETEKFYENGIKYLIFGNVLKNQTYPLSVSAERIFQAVAIAKEAKKMNADAIAHGSTGAGNDQIRFDMIFHALCPGREIITPIRDQSLSRNEEIAYLTNLGVKGDWTKAAYSINQGLWGTSVGGKETLTSDQFLPEEAFPHQVVKTEPLNITIGFEKGEPVYLNGEKLTPVNLIKKLNKIANGYGIGRDIHVGDTIIGIKGRVGFEAAASLILIKSHYTLEKHVQTKNQLFIKEGLANWYGNLLHEGNYLDPVMRDMESFFSSSQNNVTGEVKVLLAPYRFQVLGINSKNDLMQSSFGQYGEQNTAWTGDDARAFAKIYANQAKLYQTVHGKD
ncbi:MAG: argininosuccinate synthase [Cyclobacteriaceae bacterium]|jgi:argininosuccinate synthase